METKATIQVGDLVFNLEGSEQFVSREIERFSSLIMSRVGTAQSKVPEAAPAQGPEAGGEVPEPRPKKARSTSGAGQGCTAKVKQLFADGYFKEGRTTEQISAKLREQATPYAKNKISAALINLTKGRHLRRFQDGGDWLYIIP